MYSCFYRFVLCISFIACSVVFSNTKICTLEYPDLFTSYFLGKGQFIQIRVEQTGFEHEIIYISDATANNQARSKILSCSQVWLQTSMMYKNSETGEYAKHNFKTKQFETVDIDIYLNSSKRMFIEWLLDQKQISIAFTSDACERHGGQSFSLDDPRAYKHPLSKWQCGMLTHYISTEFLNIDFFQRVYSFGNGKHANIRSSMSAQEILNSSAGIKLDHYVTFNGIGFTARPVFMGVTVYSVSEDIKRNPYFTPLLRGEKTDIFSGFITYADQLIFLDGGSSKFPYSHQIKFFDSLTDYFERVICAMQREQKPEECLKYTPRV